MYMYIHVHVNAHYMFSCRLYFKVHDGISTVEVVYLFMYNVHTCIYTCIHCTHTHVVMKCMYNACMCDLCAWYAVIVITCNIIICNSVFQSFFIVLTMHTHL